MATKALINPTKGEFYIPPDDRLRALVPHRSVTIKGKEYDAFPHVTDVTRLARNLDYTVPAPVYVRYPWKDTNAFETQRITAALLTMHRRAYVLNEMGTGKTRAALYAIHWMLMQNEIKRVLVVAPLSTLDQVWAYEVMRYFPELSTGTVYGTKKKRLKVLGEHHQIYVINHHGIGTCLDELKAMDFDVILVDEIATFRNRRTELWKNLDVITSKAPYVWGMTGSPTPQAPTDAWGQVKLLTPEKVPKYFKPFQRLTMNQITQFKWIPKPEANDIVHSVMQPAVRFKRDDCVELPPVSYSYKKVVQSKEQTRVYNELIKKLTIAFNNGEVTAANEGVLFSKLLQIASGWVYTKDKSIVDLAPKERLDALTELLDEAEGKVIVFADFVHTADQVYSHLYRKKYSCELVTGQTSTTERNRIFGSFQRLDSPRIIVAHPKCMAHGLTLTEASMIVWYTPTTSLETYEQACARITRPGQTRKQLIAHLTGTAVESKVYRRLKEKGTVQGALLDLFAEIAS